MGTYYTKCGRQFEKSTNASTTGYYLKENFRDGHEIIYDDECEKCPFVVEVTEGYPVATHNRFECRAGSKPPNQKNDWIGSLENKNTISIRSLNNDFLGAVMAYCKETDDLAASYNQDMEDCRRVISVSCSGNKKGIAAKKKLIEKFFPVKFNNGCSYYRGSKGPAVTKKPEIKCGENVTLTFKTPEEFHSGFQICNGNQVNCRAFLFQELERMGQRPQINWDTDAMKEIYQSLVNEGVVVNHEDAKEVSQQETCGTCDNYHPDAECHGTGRCPERMTIRSEGQNACQKHKPKICTQCENEDTGCAPNTPESGLCAAHVRKQDPKRYVDEKGRLIFVRSGIGGDTFKAVYKEAGKWDNFSAHGVKSPELHWRKTPEEAQADLDAYAGKKGWKVHVEQLEIITPACEESQCPFHACMSDHCQLGHMIENVPHIVREMIDEVTEYCPDFERLVNAMHGGCGPVDSVKCRINQNGYCGLDTASFEDMDTEAPNCGFIRVNDRYLMEKYGVLYKEFNCGNCANFKYITTVYGVCPMESKHEDRYEGAKACSDFIKKGVDALKTCEGCTYLQKSGQCNNINNDREATPETERCGWYRNAKTGETDELHYTVCPSDEEHKDINKPDETITELFKTENATPAAAFDYSTVDCDTAAFLQEKEQKITQIRMMSVYAIGKELKEAQDKLADHNQGTFGKWCESLGFGKSSVYNYISAYSYVVQNLDNLEAANSIQPSLLFAISKPSAPKELQKAVMDGDITSHKQYKELEQKLREAEAKAETERNAYQRVSESYDRLQDTNRKHYERSEQLRKELEATKKQKEDSEKVNQLETELKEAQRQVEILKDELMTPVDLEPAVVEKVPEEVEQELAELRRKTIFAEDYNLIADVLGKLMTAHPGMLKNWARVSGKENSKDSLLAIKGELIGIRTKLESMIDYLDEEIQNKEGNNVNI